MKRIYIAYGSNMNVGQMADRCPDSRLLGVSQIDGYALEFHGGGGAVATIVPREDSRVPVVLWEISERDERNLDRYEGFPRLYFKKDFRVYLGKRKVSAFNSAIGHARLLVKNISLFLAANSTMS